MEGYNRLSTGIDALDHVIDGLRRGENVVWQVESADDYRTVAQRFVSWALDDGHEVNYLRFGDAAALLSPDLMGRVSQFDLNPSEGFEAFASAVNAIVTSKGPGAIYLFDPLTELLPSWRSDLLIGNFFRVTAPHLFDLDAIAYFGLVRSTHTFTTLATIRDVTQLLFDLYRVDGQSYLQPLKIWLRQAPEMLLPREVHGDQLQLAPDTARLMAHSAARTDVPDYWDCVVQQARDAERDGDPAQQARAAEVLITMLIGREGRLVELCRRHLRLADLLHIIDRQIGTGAIGGKSVGMLVARAILRNADPEHFARHIEEHDSFFLGSDLFYSYIIANGWWDLWAEQKTPRGYFAVGADLHRRLGSGRFPPAVRDQLVELLNYYGDAPIIVRSSSLLEDNFGNAFAGKYESVFCANRGTPAQRLRELEDAIRTVYASLMSKDALNYRRNRGLDKSNEQMAILVQRISGEQHGDYFFPLAAGVGNSSNLYVWDPTLDPEAGMLRLVFGLGTRAVDRTFTDYPKLIALDKPLLGVDVRDDSRHTQRYVDVVDLNKRQLATVPLVDLADATDDPDWDLCLSVDQATLIRLRNAGRPVKRIPKIIDFQRLLKETDFASLMRDALETLSQAYGHPVDTEYTVNVDDQTGDLKINFVQCRPLQTRGLGKAVAMPGDVAVEQILFSQHGNFMGGNVRLPLDYVVVVRPEQYLALGQQDRYAVARAIGRVNKTLASTSFLLAGPGRWGTTTPSLGVPVHFTEISNAAVLAEFTYAAGHFRPELSQGSHFFQEMVEAGLFYAAIFDQRRDVTFRPQLITESPNLLGGIAPALGALGNVIHVAETKGLVLYSDIATQKVICCTADPVPVSPDAS